MKPALTAHLDQIDLQFEDNAAVCVVLASDGYPVKYEKGIPIRGLENFKDKDGYYVFPCRNKFRQTDRIVTNGGRVLGVTATGNRLERGQKECLCSDRVDSLLQTNICVMILEKQLTRHK